MAVFAFFFVSKFRKKQTQIKTKSQVFKELNDLTRSQDKSTQDNIDNYIQNKEELYANHEINLNTIKQEQKQKKDELSNKTNAELTHQIADTFGLQIRK